MANPWLENIDLVPERVGFDVSKSPYLISNLLSIINAKDVLANKQNALISAISQFQTEELYGDVAKKASEGIDQYRKRAQEMLQTNKGMNRLRFTDAQQVELRSMRVRLNQGINYATGLLKDYDKSLDKAGEYFKYGMLDENAFRQVGTIHDTWKTELARGKELGDMTDPMAIIAKNMTGKPLKEMAINKVYPVLLRGQNPYESFDAEERRESFKANFPENSKEYRALYKPQEGMSQEGMSYDKVMDWYVKGAETQYYQKTYREPYQSPATVPYEIDFIKTSDGKYFANLGAVPVPYKTEVEGESVSGYVTGIEYDPETGLKMIFHYQTEVEDPTTYGKKVTAKKTARISYDKVIERKIGGGYANLDFSNITGYEKSGGTVKTTYYRMQLDDGKFGLLVANPATREKLLLNGWTEEQIEKLEKVVK